MSLSLVDVHAHLQDPKFGSDLQPFLSRLRKAGVGTVIVPGTDERTSIDAVRLSEKVPEIFAMVGIHPHDAVSYNDSSEANLERLLDNPKVLGVGEIGLDYHYHFSPNEVQRKVFSTLWRFAAEHGSPVAVHVREAFEDFFPLIADLPRPPGVLLHCFSGDMGIARKALDLGFHFSIGGVLTFPKSDETREIFKHLPENRIHIETDCPYLAPQSRRGKLNEPSLIPEVFFRLCEIRKTEPSQLSRILSQNARELFGPKLQACGPAAPSPGQEG